jgi:hypothetical protein
MNDSRHNHNEQCSIKLLVPAIIILLACLLCAANSTQAEERLEMDVTAIIGSTELPKLIHILPWQRTKPVEGMQAFTSIIEQEFATIRRDTFRREIEIYHYLDDNN